MALMYEYDICCAVTLHEEYNSMLTKCCVRFRADHQVIYINRIYFKILYFTVQHIPRLVTIYITFISIRTSILGCYFEEYKCGKLFLIEMIKF